MRRLLAVMIAFCLVSAAEITDPDELFNEGNAAFGRKDFEQAVQFYTQAEERTRDPGKVAFNKAAALYRLGRFRDAELHYRRAMEDAQGLRRPRILFDLGNCLLQQSQESDATLLEQGMECYRLCLQEPGLPAGLAADARRNLELAKLLWLKIKPSGKQSDPPENPNQPEDRQPPKSNRQPGSQGDEPQMGPHGKRVRLDKKPGSGKFKDKAIQTDERPLPGAGNMSPVPNKNELLPMTPEDALLNLRKAADRIRLEQQQYQKGSVPAPPGGVKDW